MAEVTRLAPRAVELGKDDAAALAPSGWALAFVVHDLEAGAALSDRALALNSNLAEAWFWGGWVKIWLGEPEAAIERFARALRLSPLGPFVAGMRSGTSFSHFFLGRFYGAVIWAAKIFQGNADFLTGCRTARANDAQDRKPAQW